MKYLGPFVSKLQTALASMFVGMGDWGWRNVRFLTEDSEDNLAECFGLRPDQQNILGLCELSVWHSQTLQLPVT